MRNTIRRPTNRITTRLINNFLRQSKISQIPRIQYIRTLPRIQALLLINDLIKMRQKINKDDRSNTETENWLIKNFKDIQDLKIEIINRNYK